MSELDWPLTEERLALAETIGAMSELPHEQLSAALDAAGIPWIGIPESEGGSGGQDADLAVAIRVLAARGMDASLAETGFVSSWALRQCAVSLPDRHIAPAFGLDSVWSEAGKDGTWLVSGHAMHVAGTQGADSVLLPVAVNGSWHLALVSMADVEVSAGANLAGDSRADLHLTAAPAQTLLALPSGLDVSHLRGRLALARSIQISGALLAVRDLTVSYARTREQFGKPIAEQQAVAHMLASIAEQSLLAEAAVATAMRTPTLWNSAIAKSVSSRAARAASATAHQVHGAMGMSQEYPLGALTTRLWSWAEEAGRPEVWEAWIGLQFMQQDHPQLWEAIVSAGEGRNP